MTKPVFFFPQLRPNYGVLDALQHALQHVRDVSSADIVQQSLPARVSRMGVPGGARFVLPPSSMVEVPSIVVSVVGATVSMPRMGGDTAWHGCRSLPQACMWSRVTWKLKGLLLPV